MHIASLALAMLTSLASAEASASVIVTVTPLLTISAPRGAQRIPMLELSMHADCSGTADAYPIEEIRLRRRGLGFSSDVSAVYAEATGVRVSTAVEPARDGSLVLRLREIFVAPCSTDALTILMDLSASASVASEHRLELDGTDAVIITGANVIIRSMSTSDPRRSIRTAGDRQGSVTIDYLRLLKTVRYGDNRVVARMRLSASGNGDQFLSRIVLTNDGSARGSDLRNLVLSDARGTPISKRTTAMVGDRVVLLIDPPYRIPDGTTKTVELRADVRTGYRRTIRFLVEEPGDITVTKVRGRGQRLFAR